MNWRDYKRPQEGFKGPKGFKLLEETPLEPLKPLKPAEPVLKSKRPVLSRPEQHLVNEAERRIDFCSTHREMKGGCTHHDITKSFQAGDRIAALNECLLWKLILTGGKIELAGSAVILGGLTVDDILRWIAQTKDLDAIRKERRLLLPCAVTMTRQ